MYYNVCTCSQYRYCTGSVLYTTVRRNGNNIIQTNCTVPYGTRRRALASTYTLFDFQRLIDSLTANNNGSTVINTTCVHIIVSSVYSRLTQLGMGRSGFQSGPGRSGPVQAHLDHPDHPDRTRTNVHNFSYFLTNFCTQNYSGTNRRFKQCCRQTFLIHHFDNLPISVENSAVCAKLFRP